MVFILLALRETGPRLVKRRQALVETNLSRNSQLVTHRCDGPGSWLRLAPRLLCAVGPCAFSKIDRFPHAWENSRWVLVSQSAWSRQLRTPPGSCSPGRSAAGAHCSTDR